MTETDEKHQRLRIGDGIISGYIAIFLGIMGNLATICFHYPNIFTTPEITEAVSGEHLRIALYVGLGVAYLFAFISALLCERKVYAAWGTVLCTLAIICSSYLPGVIGSDAEIIVADTRFYIGLDWLIIDLVLTAILFIPLELAYPKKSEQSKFHPEWRTDLTYFAVSHLAIQVFGLIAQQPAVLLFGNLGLEGLHDWTQSLPFWAALFLLMVLADLCQYWTHRIFHTSKFLWRFHAIHHSTRAMDWMSGSRTHFMDIFMVRSVSFLPLYIFGFGVDVFGLYLIIVSIQAVLAHANTRLDFGFLKYLLVTPQYHHWHHSADPDVYGKNYSIHFPFIDYIFGTMYIPGKTWTEETGLDDAQFPKGYLKQAIYPFIHDPFTEPSDKMDVSDR